jgi:hypothetical protein
VSLAPNSSNGSAPVTLAATVTSTGSTVSAAEYFVDAVGADGSGCALGGSFGGASASVSVTILTTGATPPCADLATLANGNRAFYVHGEDAIGAWGATSSAVLSLDTTGPSVSGLALTPGITNGSVYVALQATGSDAATGGQTVTAAEYSVDGGMATPISVGTPATDVGLNATISAATVAALADGNHTVAVRAQDALGNWGALGSIILTVDKTGPATSGVSATPSAVNNAGVAVNATASDVARGNSSIAGGELFLDTVGAPGTGTAMTVGAAAPSTTLSGTIPAATVAALTAGTHVIYVRARDTVANWGATASATLLIDRTAPTFTSITLTPSSITVGTASVALAVNGATDPLVGGLASGVVGGEWWIGTSNITAGTGTAFTGLTTSVNTGSRNPGTYTVRVRIRDVAGNWSTGTNGVRTATLTVTPPDAIFSDGFETGTLSPLTGWSSRSTTTTSRLNVTAASRLVGNFGLQAQGANANYVQYNFGTAASPASPTYDARFYFNPTSNASTGQDILAAATSSGFGTQLFHVRYRQSAGQAQAQVQVGTTANSAWVNLAVGANGIEVVWQSGSTLQLYVNGTLSQALTATTGSVGAIRMGSLTSGASSTLMYFDAFASKRSVSPLIGP